MDCGWANWFLSLDQFEALALEVPSWLAENGKMWPWNYRSGRFWGLVALAATVGMLSACASTLTPRRGAPPVAAQDRRMRPAIYPALEGTVESFCALAFDRPTVVRGYGLVADLPDTGSGEMPPPIRHMMLDRLYRNGIGFLSHGTAQYDPRRILHSRQIAAVYIEGAVPPLAQRGTTFDLYVTALPNTQTTNLENGLLWPARLRVNVQPALKTPALAQGRGPVFCNPFDSAGRLRPATALVRSGMVPGGGVVTRSMPVWLELYQPSWRIAALVQRMINQRYGAYPAIATAENDRVVNLRIPRRYRRHPDRFVQLVGHLYLQQNLPGFTSHQGQLLIHDLRDPNAPRRGLGLALQQLGRTIIPTLRRHYASANPAVRFYCLKAGAMLGDIEAINRLTSLATDESNAFQLRAIHVLENCRDRVHASLAFTRLLSSPDLAMHILAYKALRRIHSPLIYSHEIGGRFRLEVLPCKAPTLIYVTTSGFPTIALIGRAARLLPGSLYVSGGPNHVITVDYPFAAATPVRPGAATQPRAALPVLLYYRDPLTQQVVRMAAAPSLPAIITALAAAPNPFSPDYRPNLPYIALSYQRLVVALYSMCRLHEINATFRLQKIIPNQMALLAALNSPRPDRRQRGLKTNSGRARSPYATSLPGEMTHAAH